MMPTDSRALTGSAQKDTLLRNFQTKPPPCQINRHNGEGSSVLAYFVESFNPGTSELMLEFVISMLFLYLSITNPVNRC